MAEQLIFMPPDEAIAPWVLGFAYRRDGRGGDVVFELPELRSTIQIMLGDDYWLRDRADPESWATVPRIALWGPRITWGYGFARGVIHAFGIGLTPRGVEALTGRTAEHFVDRVMDLTTLRPDIAGRLSAITSRGTADDWRREASALLAPLATMPAPVSRDLDPAISVLANDDATSVSHASEAAGVGGRQFRRVFRSNYGLSPRQYRRILRIDRMLRRLHPDPWEEDRLETAPGFADQAHMIREFKALTGVTPGEYVRAKRKHGDATLRSVVVRGVAPPSLC